MGEVTRDGGGEERGRAGEGWGMTPPVPWTPKIWTPKIAP